MILNCNENKMHTIKTNLVKGDYVHLIFINKEVEYVFCNYESFDNNNKFSEIFETTDGGKMWHSVKKNSYLIASNVTPYYYNGELYFGLEANNNFFITSLKSKKYLGKSKSLYSIFNLGNKIYYSNSLGITNIETGKLMNGISIGNDLSTNGNNLITIKSDKTTDYLIKYSIDDNFKMNQVKSNLHSFKIAKQIQGSNLIFAGQDNLGKINISKLDIRNDNIVALYSTNKYSIVENLQTDKSIISCFLGNIVGGIVKYDILYSLDYGNTWNIKSFNSLISIHPNFRISNNIYILTENSQFSILDLKDK